MTTHRSVLAAVLATSPYGNAFIQDAKATITSNLTTADEVILHEIPAGTRLSELKYRAGDLDSGTTLVGNLGYRSVHPNQEVAAAPTYFLSASAAFQAAQASWVDLPFEPITFKEPVQIVFKPTVNATGLSGTPAIYSIAKGSVIGVPT